MTYYNGPAYGHPHPAPAPPPPARPRLPATVIVAAVMLFLVSVPTLLLAGAVLVEVLDGSGRIYPEDVALGLVTLPLGVSFVVSGVCVLRGMPAGRVLATVCVGVVVIFLVFLMIWMIIDTINKPAIVRSDTDAGEVAVLVTGCLVIIAGIVGIVVLLFLPSSNRYFAQPSGPSTVMPPAW